ncbi:MAG: aldo/keto reductase, partial [Tannerella sp.]|nr:aldo/keto reductase [Tannerella sp.]
SFCHYTLNDDSLTDYLDYFESQGIGVINASPFAMGLLTERGIPGWHPAPEALKRLAVKAAACCKAKGASIEQLAVSYAASHPRITTTLFSTTNPEHVLRTIRYAATPPDRELLKEIQQVFEPGFRDTWVNS